MTRLALSFALLIPLLAPAAAAQSVASLGASFGVAVVDGQVCAGGPDYTARFADGRCTFVPVLGRGATADASVGYTLESVRRGDAVLWAGPAPASPAVDGNVVRYVRGDGLTEVYEARASGIEQSFVFAERPAGHGDLVVRGRLATALPLVAQGDRGLRFERAGLGGVAWGAVTGIDRTGATVAGSIRVDGDRVEWVLPAAFVERAAYPLVLDPLVAAVVPVADAVGVDQRPALAYDVTTGRYLVAWTVVVSASLCELRAQLLSALGNPVGGMLTLSTNADADAAPAVANVNSTNRFLVVWRVDAGQVKFLNCVAVNASNGAVSSIVSATSGTSHAARFGVGGDQRAVGDKCLLAYTQAFFGTTLTSVTVQVPAAGAPVLSAPTTVISGPFGSVAVARSAGAGGRWLVAWTKSGVGTGPYRDIACTTVDEAGTVCAPIADIYTGPAGADVSGLSCTTADGTQYAVAWQDNVSNTVFARPVQQLGLCGSALTLGSTIVPSPSANVQTAPSIDFAGGKYVLAWTEFVPGTGLRTFAKGLDPATCAACGAVLELEASSTPQDQPAVAARRSGGDTASDEALVVWSDGSIRGRRFEAVGSHTVASMGGACGIAAFENFATYDGDAVLGNLDFELVLANPTLPVLALVIGLSPVSLGCGPCTLVPALDILVPFATQHPVPIPCDLSYLDVDFYAQWLLLAPGGCPILPDFALSNALRFTIGE